MAGPLEDDAPAEGPGAVHDVFLSYKSEEAARAEPIASALQGVGLAVWWDRRISVGGTWAQEIQRAIEQSKTVVVLWTEMSVGSDWVHKEARKGESRGVLVPARLDDVAPPFEFEHVQAANLIGWDGVSPNEAFNDLVEAVSSLAGRKVDPRPAPTPARVRKKTWARPALLGAVAVLSGLGAFGFGRAPAASTQLSLQDLELDGLRFAVSEPTSMMPLQVPSLFVSGGDLEMSSVSIRPEAGQTEQIDGPPFLLIAVREGEGTISLTGLDYPADSLFELQRTPTEFRLSPPNVGAREITLTGVVTLTSNDARWPVDFGRRGTIIVTEDSGIFFDIPLESGQDGAVLLSRAELADLELFRVASSVDDPEPTILGGTLTANWLEGERLLAGQRLGFDSFAGAMSSLELANGVLTTSITGYAVQGVRLGGNDIMPSNWASLGLVRQVVFSMVLLGFLAFLMASVVLSLRRT